MYRLMLLDDEEIVIRGIRKVFDLEKAGFALVGTFNSPLKALEQIESLRPDLIITDVKMPQMDGLEFARQARQKDPDVEIVILSGYDDFSYAQAAVRIGISDYLLKPIKKEDFRSMLAKMREKISEKTSTRDYYQSLKEQIRNSYMELKNRFFLALAEDGVFDKKLYQALLGQWDADIDEAEFLLVKADILEIPADRDYMSELGRLTREMTDLLSTCGKVEEFLSDESLYFFLRDICEEEGNIRNVVLEAAELQRQGGIRLSIGISLIHRGLQELFAARNDCIRQIFLSEAHIDESSDANPVREQEVNVNIPYTKIETLFQEISDGNEQKLTDIIENMYRIPKQDMNILYRDYSFSITFLILLRIYQMQNKYGANSQIVGQSMLDLKNLHREYPTAESQKKLVNDLSLQLCRLIAGEGTTAPSRMIQSALDYINAHFCENISLQEVADNINISKNYLCDIFKKELGLTFINYVTNLRIEKAKEYLANTDMKMYEVSSAVGFNDYAYFSQIFKKHTGTTLSAYRRKA